VRKRYRDAIRETVLRELIGESWRTAVDQEGLKPIADPRVRDLRFEDGVPVTFELLVEVKPELALPRLGGFRLTRRVRPVTEEMVEEQLESLRRERAPWVPAERPTPRAGDLVSVAIATVEDDAAREPRDYQLVLGQGQAVPDVEERILGLTRGQTAEATVRFPDDHADESKRGQTRAVRISLHEIKEQRLPELTDDFARELGDFDSVAALRAAVRADLEAEARRDADTDLRRELIDRLIEANGVQAPRPMVQRVLHAFAQAYQVPDERLGDFAAEFGPIAERQVKRDLIIDHVAERQGLRAAEEDVDRRIQEIAARRKAEPGQVYASLQKAGRLAEVERSVTEEKVFAFLLTQSTIQDE
jgi:trigger factor